VFSAKNKLDKDYSLHVHTLCTKICTLFCCYRWSTGPIQGLSLWWPGTQSSLHSHEIETILLESAPIHIPLLLVLSAFLKLSYWIQSYAPILDPQITIFSVDCGDLDSVQGGPKMAQFYVRYNLVIY